MNAQSTWHAVAARAASLLLRYPDDDVMASLPTVQVALADLPEDVSRSLSAVAKYRAAMPQTGLQAEYVALFDFRRRCCLHLTYYTCGDTRKRGEALVGFAAAYKAAGLEVVGGELPDYLPAVLDLAAAEAAVESVTESDGWRLLRENRVGLDLLAEALSKEESLYRNAIQAVRAMLPPARPGDIAAAVRLAQTGPPVEQVGLEPFGLTDTIGGRR